ncbi:leukemia NUP98 fusion partner 1, partial [Hemibagrus wyckioides]|uniref:leukemia NUP98 fusion partner 1 n=1 Tax=Hemibagrus wyckioides TaxID=337641 RepID=UPI00266CA715
SSAGLQSLASPSPSFFTLVFYLRRGAPARAPHTPASKLSLRLLPAIIVDNDEDDDGNFTKWMSSYWGHGDGDERAKARKRSFRRSRQSTCDRRASLPCMSQLEAIRLKHPLTPTHIQRHEDQREMRSHPHARRVSSDEYRGTKAGGAESRTSTVPELTESFKRMLRFRNHRVPALSDPDACLISREEMCRRGGETGRGAQELHCSHRFHKETVSLRQRQESELEVAELKMLRFSLGGTRLDRIRNEYIRGTAHVGHLGDKVREDRLRWFGHVQRRESEYICRRMLDMELPGRRKRGRPKRRYMDGINEDMKLVGVSVEDGEDRDRWREMIHCGDP